MKYGMKIALNPLVDHWLASETGLLFKLGKELTPARAKLQAVPIQLAGVSGRRHLAAQFPIVQKLRCQQWSCPRIPSLIIEPIWL